MAGQLFPVVPTPPQLQRAASPAPPGSQIKPDWAFDFAKGDLVVDNLGNVQMQASLPATVAQQCITTLLVDRATYLVHTRAFGINYEYAQALPRRKETQNSIEQQVRRQLRRVQGVVDVVQFRWPASRNHDDRAQVEFTVQIAGGASRRVSVALPGDIYG